MRICEHCGEQVKTWVLFNPASFADQRRYLDATLAEIFATTNFNEYQSVKPPAFMSKSILLRILPKIVWRSRVLITNSLRAAFRPIVFQKIFDKELEIFDRSLDGIDAEATILVIARQLCTAYVRAWVYADGPALGAFFFGGIMALDRLIDSKSTAQKTLAEQIKGGGDQFVMEMNLAIYKLAEMLSTSSFSDAVVFKSKLESGDLPEEFRTLWEDFMHRFGCRGAWEMDLLFPRYVESPDQFIELLISLSKSDSVDLEETLKERNERKKTAYEELRTLLSPKK